GLGLTRGHKIRGVANREDVIVARGLQRWPDDELIGAGDLKAIEIGKNAGPLDASGPDDERRGDKLTGLQRDAFFADGGDAGIGADFDAEIFEDLGGRRRKAFGQSWQNTRCGLNQRYLDVLLRIDAIEAVGDDAACG